MAIMKVTGSGLELRDSSSNLVFQHIPRTLTVSVVSATLCCCAKSLRDGLLVAQAHRLNLDKFIRERDLRK